MFVCSQCQFENPETHRFCQACGASLTHLDCPACGTSVERSVETCPHCGTMTGQIWRAILTPAASNRLETSDPEPLIWEKGDYLDAEQRYQLREPCSIDSLAATGFEVSVLDCKPLQPARWSTPTPETIPSVTETEPSPRFNTDLPAIARPYLALETEIFPALPTFHDVLSAQGYSILLLEERITFPSLLTGWRDDAVLPLQIIRWLHDLTKLWLALEAWDCRQSLLELDNLRLDEDQVLCLRRLYFDPVDRVPSLQDFGKLWQKLFQQSQRTFFASLASLCLDLEAGRVTTIDELQSHLSAIADELQPGFPPSIGTSSTSIDFADSGLPLPKTAASVERSSTPMDDDPSFLSGTSTLSVTDILSNSPNILEDEIFINQSLDESTALEDSPNDDLAPENLDLGENDDSPTVVLPMRLMAIEDAGSTDIGQQRDHNEDSFSIQLELNKVETPMGRSLHAKGIYLLCDGMGGHEGGEVASALAVEILQQYFATHWADSLPNEDQVREAIQLANQAIYDSNQSNDRLGSSRMGTTLVMALIQDNQVIVAHVGDSRLYRFSRRLGLQQVTVDHEVGQREIQRGVEPAIAYARPDAYQLTQALGPRDKNFINPSVEFLELSEDSLLILCSDGLSDNDLLEIHWRTHLEPLLSSRNNLEEGVSQLIDLANQYNGHDNITAIVIRVRVRPKVDALKRA